MIQSSNPGQEDEQGLLNKRITTVLVFQDQPADFIKVSHHELATDPARHGLNLHPLSPGVALGKPRKSADR